MNSEREIAQAIIDAQKMREESYKAEDGTTEGVYTKDLEHCLMETCKKNNCSSNLWYMLGLAMHWWNDIQGWGEDILANKDIPKN